SLAALGHAADLLGMGLGSPLLARWFSILYGWWAAITLTIGQIELGRRIQGWSFWGAWGEIGAIETIFRFGLGSWATATAVLVLSICGASTAPVLRVIGGLFVVLALLNCLRPARGQHNSTLTETGVLSFWVIAAAIWFVPYLLQTLLPNTD